MKYTAGVSVALGAGVGGAITGIVSWIHGQQSIQNLASGSPKGTPTPTASGSSSASSSSNTAEPTEWIFNTVPGTSMEAFDKFIKTLPDRGQGDRIVFPNLRDQVYVGLMTREEAIEINKNPIVDQLTEASSKYSLLDAGSDFYDLYNNRSSVESGQPKLSSRAPNYDFEITQFPTPHLQLISWPKDKNFYQQSFVALEMYVREKSDGQGTFVYVLDSGVDFTHSVSHFHTFSVQCPLVVASRIHSVYVLILIGLYFNQEFRNIQSPEHYSAPRLVTTTGDQVGHGTKVAAMIVGHHNGVARKTTIVDVKIMDSPVVDIRNIADGFRFAVSDIIAKGRRGKATINMSFGESSKILGNTY